MKKLRNFWFNAFDFLGYKTDFDYMLHLHCSKLHKGMENVFGPGVKIKETFDEIKTCLSTYYKGENYGPTFEYSTPTYLYRGAFRYDIDYNVCDMMNTIEERYEVKGKRIGKFRRPILFYEKYSGVQGYYIDSKRWFNCIEYGTPSDTILGKEYWYVDGELQDFGRILYKDKTYKFIKFNLSNESEYEEVNKKEVEFKSYVDEKLWNIGDDSYKVFVKEFKPNIKNKDIIIKIKELKEDDELFATDIDIEINDEVTKLRTYAKLDEFGNLYAITNASFEFYMKEKSASYFYIENGKRVKRIIINHESNYFQNMLLKVYDSQYIERLRTKGKTLFGYNKIYNNVSYYIIIQDYKLKKQEKYYYDKYMFFGNLNKNNEIDGKMLKITPDCAVYEQFWDNRKVISDFEFVDYIKSIDEIDEF